MIRIRHEHHLHHHFDESFVQALKGNPELLQQFDKMERLMAQIDDILAMFRTFITDLKEREKNIQARIDAAVAKALADDEIKDTAAAQVLADEIAAARVEFPPVAPPAEISNL